MELWTGVLSGWKCHWPDLKSAGLFPRNLPKNLNIVTLTLSVWPINCGVLTSLLLSYLSPSLTDSLPSLNLLCHSKTDARFTQDGRKAVWSIPYVSVVYFPSLKHNFIAYRSSKVSSRPDCIFEIPSCDNQSLVGCIPIAPVAVHLNLKSEKLVSRLKRCIAITYGILNACTKKSGNLLKVPRINISLSRVFHTSVSWWFFIRVLLIASLLNSPGLFSVFWPISTML